MAECLAAFGGGPPSSGHRRLYERWAEGDWGMVITGWSLTSFDQIQAADALSGNVQIDPSFLATPWDVSLPHELAALSESAADFRALASTFDSTETPLVVQLSHPGRQSPLFCRWPFSATPPAPSSVRVGGTSSDTPRITQLFNLLMFRRPSELSDDEVVGIAERFGEAAAWLEETGFSGVEIHGAHGCK